MGWQLIKSYNVGDSITAAPAASITFDSIPQTFKSLKLMVSARSDNSGIDNLHLSFNGSTANFSYRWVYGNGATATSSSASSNLTAILGGTGDTSNTFSNTTVDIPNYSGSTNKAFASDGVNENNGTTAYQILSANLWASSAALTSITIAPAASYNFIFGSTFTLYGLL